MIVRPLGRCPGALRNQSQQLREKQSLFISASVPISRYLFMADCQVEEEVNPFLSKLLLAMVFVTLVEKRLRHDSTVCFAWRERQMSLPPQRGH